MIPKNQSPAHQESSPAGQCGSLSVIAGSPLSLGDVKALYDELIRTRLALRVLVPKLVAGENVSPQILRSLEDQYCGPECQVDALEVVVRSRKQFDDVAIEAMNLRREVEYLRNHLRAAREERDELIKANTAYQPPEGEARRLAGDAGSAIQP